MDTFLSNQYWNNRYSNNEIGWDLGAVSPALKIYFDKLTDKTIRILIPGGGNGYEASYLHENGFKHVTLLDFAEEPLIAFRKKHSSFSEDHLIHQDFFQHSGSYDLIVEQTFFCALSPNLRVKYVEHMKKLLVPQGKLVGLLFDREFSSSPPYGGSLSEYEQLFSKHFRKTSFTPCETSHPARLGSELFIEIQP